MRKNKEEIINLYNKYGLKLIDEFINVDTSLRCTDSFGYMYSITPYNLSIRKSLNMCSGAFNNKNPFKYDNINLYVNKEGLGSKLIKIPKAIDVEPCLFECRICHNNFYQLFKVFKGGKYKCCPKCSKKKRKQKNKGIAYIQDIFNKAGYKLLENKDKGMHHAYYIMDKDGYKGKMLPYTAKKKHSAIEKFHSRNIYSIENINRYLRKNNINLVCVETGIFETYKALEFKCPCGDIFCCMWDNVKKGKWKCNKCSNSISNNEYKVKVYLDYLKVKYISQYNIGKCRNYNKLLLDFYIPDLELAIEVNGEQHYMPVRFGGMDVSQSLKNFNKQQEKDALKRKYCIDKDIELIEISYVDIKNEKYKEILSMKINDLRK